VYTRGVVNMWFESVAVAQRRARRVLPKPVYDALLAGSERGTTMSDNVAAFAELGWLPVVVDQPAGREMATTVIGQPLSMPVLISPTGVQAVHPDGEIAAARAAASRGVAYGLSSFAGKAIEDVIAANPQTLFQTYWAGGREAIVDRIERAKTAGAVGLILTTDWSFSHARDWGSPSIPQRIDLPTMLRQFPAVLTKPRWLTRWARAGLRPPGLEVPNFVALGVPAPRFFDAYGEWMQTPPPTWDDVAWLVEQWNGPLMLKGVMRVEDAKRAIDAGVTAISVSNHGGNNLDGSPAPVRVLQSIAEAVGHRVEVLMDGGVRRGSDVVKAVALGARAVMIGRAALWGLAVAGQQGVENVLDVLRNGIDSALLGIGKASIAELAPGDLLIPAGFSPG
jgi:heme/flavin dehydrogenase (mycofactocin system)